jgi:hypothetical protein
VTAQAIVVRRGTVGTLGNRDEQAVEHGEATLNKAAVTLSRVRSDDYGSLTDEAGTLWTITGIVRQSRSVYVVNLQRTTRTQVGRTTLAGGR